MDKYYTFIFSLVSSDGTQPYYITGYRFEAHVYINWYTAFLKI